MLKNDKELKVWKKGGFFEGNCLMNELRVTRVKKPDAVVLKLSGVVQY